VTGPAGRYALTFRPAALRALRKLDRQIAERIKAATEALQDDPRPPGAKMLTGSHGLWRIRIGPGALHAATVTQQEPLVPRLVPRQCAVRASFRRCAARDSNPEPAD
jgi:hypothetical protein